jgi:short-subunit dehydrogenase
MADLLALKGKTAVVTGAAGGIGRAIAVSLARRGCDLALADVNEVGLKEVQAELTGLVEVSRHRLDVSDPAAVAMFPDEVLARHPGVDVLVNNAGVALGGQFDQVSAADFEWLISVNFWGVVNMTRAFLPLLKASPEARLVNVSSVFGLIAPPGQTAYCASKFAVRGFSESLRHELKASRVGVTVVHPGGVATAIARSARMPAGASNSEIAAAHRTADAMLKLPPAVAGEIIVKGIERRRPRVLVGNDAKVLATLERLAPVSYWKWLGPRLRR